MKKLNITWADGVIDTTGYLFSFAKSLGTAVKNSPYAELAEDIIATSGFAFRMWVAANLCPSATSIWSFDDQKKWVENGGLICKYVGRYWGQDDIELQKRLEAIDLIRESIDNGIPAISWDIGVPEWGLITGYDDETQMFSTLSLTGSEDQMPYDLLGKREIPILSVLTVTGMTQKPQEAILKDTLKLAVSHLKGEEWCDSAKGLEAYPAFIKHFEDAFNPDASWNMEYYLGTYGALKYYAYKYFEKMNLPELAKLYEDVYHCWQDSFDLKMNKDINDPDIRTKIANALKHAYKNEIKAVELMSTAGDGSPS